jgi:predicted kinase
VNEQRGSVLIVSGPAASGKTTVARLVASTFERSVHVEADRFFGFVVGGYVDPWDREAHEQNTVVMEIASDAARRYAEAGYLTVLDGMFIPGWFYEPVRDRLKAASLDVSAAFIRPLEDHVIENDHDAPAATAEAVVRRLADGTLRI